MVGPILAAASPAVNRVHSHKAGPVGRRMASRLTRDTHRADGDMTATGASPYDMTGGRP
jgi:hypothetical protein